VQVILSFVFFSLSLLSFDSVSKKSQFFHQLVGQTLCGAFYCRVIRDDVIHSSAAFLGIDDRKVFRLRRRPFPLSAVFIDVQFIQTDSQTSSLSSTRSPSSTVCGRCKCITAVGRITF
jgi:hypothetical protein